MNLFIKPYYTIHSSVLLNLEKASKINSFPGVNLNILLDEEAVNHSGFIKIVGLLENDYIFSLPSTLISNKENLPVITPGLFLLYSLNRSEKTRHIIPVVYNLDTPERTLEANIEIIKSYFFQQGDNLIKLPVFKQEEERKNLDNCIFLYSLQSKDLAGELFSTFRDDEDVPVIVIYPSGNEYDLSWLWAIAESEDPMTKEYLMYIEGHYVEKQQADRERSLWKQRMQLYQDFLSMSKDLQQKEYYDVLNWYHKEYEVLPLWYKRLGHIIKVLMGKRTFRSLFNDNVKI